MAAEGGIGSAFDEAVELALQPDAEQRPYECRPGSVAGDGPLNPGRRLRFPYVARSARQHDQRRQAVKKGTGARRECLCPGAHAAQVHDVVRTT